MSDRFLTLLASCALLGCLLSSNVQAEETPGAAALSAEQRESYEKQIQPLLVRACGNCHGKEPKDNDLDLTRFGTAQAILAKTKMLGDVAERLRLGDMPPKEAPQLTEAEREQLDRKSTRLNSSHIPLSRMPSSA